MTIEEFITEEITDENAKALASLYLPVITRWTAVEGWDIVRKWLYIFNDTTWQITINSKMTVSERRADDDRRLAALKQFAGSNARRIREERALLQKLLMGLFTALLSKL